MVKLETIKNVSGKDCTRCLEWKPLELFYVMKRGLGGRKSQCKECCQKSDAVYREKNKEYYSKKNKENTLKYNSTQREQRKAINKKWRENNHLSYKAICLVQKQKRRAMKAMLPNNLTANEMSAMLTHFDNRCPLTGSNVIHIDHVIPLCLGHGGTVNGNLVPLRSELNLSKYNRNIFIWFDEEKEKFNLSQRKFDEVVEWLAETNKMTVVDYRDYVYHCHRNPKILGQTNSKSEYAVQ